ncbi:MAG TPA: ABC transporter ATP-binding protein [Chthoniobacterales bacterium]
MAHDTGPEALLEVEDVHVYLDSAHVLQGTSLQLNHGLLGMVGRNGMGKTTLVRTVLGLIRAQRGRIRFAGRDITHLKTYEITRRGIAYVPQGRAIFPSLSVHEHLQVAARRTGAGSWTPAAVYDLFPRLAERRRNGGGSLSGGEQQMLAIGRALVTNPRLLVMDEPSEGLSPVILEQLIAACEVLIKKGMHILLVEQNLHVVTSLVHGDLLVMTSGGIASPVPSQRLLDDQALREQLLGVALDAGPPSP